MSKKIKQTIGVILIIYLLIMLFVSVLNIWDMISIETAKDVYIKTSFTSLFIFIATLIVIFIIKLLGNENEK